MEDPPPLIEHAAEIAAQLQEDGYQYWGFVIYRTTFSSDALWAIALGQIVSSARELLEKKNGWSVFEKFKLTVIEHRELEGATSHVIREHFRNWRLDAERREQGVSTPSSGYSWPNLSQRYRFCAQVDEESLQSIIADYRENRGFVRLIDADWIPESEFPDDDGVLPEDLEAHQVAAWKKAENPLTWDIQEEVEGCTLDDVGFMHVSYYSLMVLWYPTLRIKTAWDDHGQFEHPWGSYFNVFGKTVKRTKSGECRPEADRCHIQWK